MEFTQAQAEQKVPNRQWVYIRDEWRTDDGVPPGTRGQVMGADPLGGVEPATVQEIWGVHIYFPAEDVLLINIRLDRYQASFVESTLDGQ
jgi:hypothetical protein